jgi:hypothetical protein
MYKYAKRVTRPYVRALQGGYRDMRRILRNSLPFWASRRVDHALDHIDLFLVDYGMFRAIYANRHRVAPGVWRSSQPAPYDIAICARRGIRTIINLRGGRDCGSYRLERASCERHGIRLIDFPTRSRSAPPASFFGRPTERGPSAGASRPRSMYLRTVFGSRPVRRAIAVTDSPCRCNSRIIISSPSWTIDAASRSGS